MAEPALDWEQLLYQSGSDLRRTQDSPVLPNVWRSFGENPGQPVDLLITPHRASRPAELAAHIRKLYEAWSQPVYPEHPTGNVAHNESSVAVRATFDQLIALLVPLSKWGQEQVRNYAGEIRRIASLRRSAKTRKELLAALGNPNANYDGRLPKAVVWWLRLIGHFAAAEGRSAANLDDGEVTLARALALLDMGKRAHKQPQAAGAATPRLFQISVNRKAQAACLESIRTVKADAALRVFEMDTSRLCWAVVDSGIDARHPAFEFNGGTRIKEAYDFTKIRRILTLASTPGDAAVAQLEEFGLSAEQAQAFRAGIAQGRDVDWEALRASLRVDPSKLDEYVASLSSHGTHVAGILGGRQIDDIENEGTFVGMCPEIQIIDLRVLDEQEEAGEFDIQAALQFVRYLNSSSHEPKVHGVNLSLQLQHRPRDFACGRTPICQESERLVASGVVVVAAAGNLGVTGDASGASTTEGDFRDTSIADPGNTESVITVGSTHRKRPHAYGVSYFSSRGPTGDGRSKPDLVAPGEKILGPVKDGGYERKEGTSMAAPHVSGAAALLMARHSELIGDPERIKAILCDTATDLGRERAFQGAGLVDILRALQST